jgi:DNA-binding CsgD family transcriptional regulator
MIVDDRILLLIDDIYQAALDETLWPRVMQQLLEVTDSRAATFCVIDRSQQPRLPVLTTVNFEQRFMDEYLESMVPNDPTVQYIVAHPQKKIIHDSEFITEREKDRHFYYDWHHSFSDTRHRLAGMAHPAEDVQSGITLHRTRGQGDYENQHIERFQILNRHLERAVHIGFRLGTLGSMQVVSFDLLDRNPAATFVLDEKERVIFANHAGQLLAGAGEGLALSPRGLSLLHSLDNGKLQRLIAQALNRNEGGRDSLVGAMLALRPTGRRPFSILVSPLSRTSLSLTLARPAVLVIVADTDRHDLAPESLLRALFSLTPAEARLAARLATGEELRTAADRLGIGYATARTQLSVIFRKTETRRQGELIELLRSAIPRELI